MMAENATDSSTPDINAETGLTVLLVTHDPVFAASSHRVLRLVDGALQQDITLPVGEVALA